MKKQSWTVGRKITNGQFTITNIDNIMKATMFDKIGRKSYAVKYVSGDNPAQFKEEMDKIMEELLLISMYEDWNEKNKIYY